MGKIVERQIVEFDKELNLFKLTGELPLPKILIDEMEEFIYTKVPYPGSNLKTNLYRRKEFFRDVFSG